MTTIDQQPARTPARAWAGRAVKGLTAVALAASAAVKLRGGPQAAEMMAHLGIPDTLRVPLAILELTCLAIYLAPPTAVLGAVLLTGYFGGAVFSHLRVGDSFVAPIVLGALIWLGVYLRVARLRAFLPWRRAGGGGPLGGGA